MKWGLIFDESHPITTIAWRYTHISDLFAEERCATYVGVEPERDDIFADGCPGDVRSAREVLDDAFARWKRYLNATDETKLYEEVGPVSDMWAKATRAQFVLHILDEVIHHGAEVGVLRDLYAAQQTDDPAVSALLRGDRPAESEVERVKRERPDLTLLAAATASWDAIPTLLDLGFGVGGRDGRTPLHHAAAEGLVDLIEQLIAAGADTSVRDPIYNATPAEWADYFNRAEAAQRLRS